MNSNFQYSRILERNNKKLMQIKINLKIFFFIIIFCITRQIEIYGILMLFAFFHELGHLFAGVILGFKPKSISINPVGLSISFCIKADDYNKKIRKGNVLAFKKLIIALMGPVVNFLLVILFMLFDLKLFNISREFVIYSNILIGLFNLIPIFPLDGGRIIKNLIHIIYGLKNAYTYVNVISNVSIIILTFFSSIIIFYLKNIAILIIIGYLWYLVFEENRIFAQRVKVYQNCIRGIELINKRDEINVANGSKNESK